MKTKTVKPADLKTLNPLRVGNNVLIRGVTLYYTGRIVEMDEHEVVLDDAAWIAHTGRFNEAVAKGKDLLSEVEPYSHPVAVGRGSICDATTWVGPLPREVR